MPVAHLEACLHLGCNKCRRSTVPPELCFERLSVPKPSLSGGFSVRLYPSGSIGPRREPQFGHREWQPFEASGSQPAHSSMYQYRRGEKLPHGTQRSGFLALLLVGRARMHVVDWVWFLTHSHMLRQATHGRPNFLSLRQTSEV